MDIRDRPKKRCMDCLKHELNVKKVNLEIMSDSDE